MPDWIIHQHPPHRESARIEPQRLEVVPWTVRPCSVLLPLSIYCGRLRCGSTTTAGYLKSEESEQVRKCHGVDHEPVLCAGRCAAVPYIGTYICSQL